MDIIEVLAIPAIGFVLLVSSRIFIERRITWQTFFVGQSMIVASIIMSGCLYFAPGGGGYNYGEYNLNDLGLILIIKYLVVLIFTSVICRYYYWLNNKQQLSSKGIILLIFAGAWSIYDLARIINDSINQ